MLHELALEGNIEEKYDHTNKNENDDNTLTFTNGECGERDIDQTAGDSSSDSMSNVLNDFIDVNGAVHACASENN